MLPLTNKLKFPVPLWNINTGSFDCLLVKMVDTSVNNVELDYADGSKRLAYTNEMTLVSPVLDVRPFFHHDRRWSSISIISLLNQNLVLPSSLQLGDGRLAAGKHRMNISNVRIIVIDYVAFV